MNILPILQRKHETIKDAPAVKLGVIEKRWSLEDVVRMVEKYERKKEDAEFSAAFAEAEVRHADKVAPTPKVKTYEPIQPELPWYLDETREAPPEGLDL